MSPHPAPRDLVFIRRSATTDCDHFEFFSLPGEFRHLLGDVGWAEFVETWSTLVSLNDGDEVEQGEDWYRPYVYLVAEAIPKYRSPRRMQGYMFQSSLLAACWSEIQIWRRGGVEHDAKAYLERRGMVQDLRKLIGMLEDLESRSPGFIPETFTFVPGPDGDGWPTEWTSEPKRDVERLTAIVGR